MHFKEHHFPLFHPMHRRHNGVGGGSRSSCTAGHGQQEVQGNRMADLPTGILQHVASLLDHDSRMELRKADKRCRQVVDSCWRLVCLPLAQLRRHDMESLALRFAAASCLVISELYQRVSLSRLGHRRRCEHLVAVFLDNTAQWPGLVALDLSAALAKLSPASLELLAASLPGLQHLALPKVAASSDFAHAPAHEVLHILGQLEQLRSLEFDCSLLKGSSSNSSAAGSCINSPRGGQDTLLNDGQGVRAVTAAGAVVLEQAGMLQHGGPQVVAAQHQLGSVVQHTAASTAAASRFWAASPAPVAEVYLRPGSDPQQQPADAIAGSCQGQLDSSCTSTFAQQPEYHAGHLCNPWLQLQHLRHLQQLQLVNPCSSLQEELLPALAGLQGLASLGLVKVQQALFQQLLDPGQGVSCGKGLGQLWHLTGLTRLELGLQQPCSCKGSQVLPTTPLIIPPHSTSVASAPAAAAAAAATATAIDWVPLTAPAAPGQLSPLHDQLVCRFSVHSCCWSHLGQLQVLVLGGISLDCPLLAATAACCRLRELHVGGLQLEDELPLGFGGLQELQLLAVSQRFSLGPNCAAALFPSLVELSIRDDSSSCPNLSCLQHHVHLRSLAVEAAGPRWQLSSLQLGHLVHISSLRQLSLASRGSGGHLPAHAQSNAPAHAHAHVHGQVQVGGHVSPGRGQPRMMSPGGGSGSHSSHWLPTASLSQVTLLTLSGPCTDHTLSQLPSQFPGLVSLQLLGSYYASDWGLKRLCKAPQLSALLLDGCEHVTEYGLEVLIRGGGIKVLVVNDCSGVDERACQRIRRACRNSCTCLHWHGTDDSRSSHGSCSSLSTSGSGYMSPYFDSQASHNQQPQQQQHHHHQHPCLDSAVGSSSCNTGCHCSSGSVFLERCWREAEGADEVAGMGNSSSTLSHVNSSGCSNTACAVGELGSEQQASSSSSSSSSTGSDRQAVGLAAAAPVAAAELEGDKASLLHGLAHLRLAAADGGGSHAGPSTPRRTEGHRSVASSSSYAAFDLQQQQQQPDTAVPSITQPVDAAGCSSSSVQSQPAAQPARSVVAIVATTGGQQAGAVQRSSEASDRAVAPDAEAGRARVMLSAGRIGCSAAHAPASAAAGVALQRSSSSGAAAGVALQRSSSSGAGGGSSGGVRRSSCVAAGVGESSGTPGLPRWPRHSNPGPACAH